ncbi:hypothetical protein [Dolichospermum sp. UHCC 0259]|uniref:hypothetical protein n=1 Tax=Dolichospermum sp. UHCC 0259 TaxID=2590010 RepID=UPI00144754BD|nr:hypothetical protein [Dolichospermum sp. UHCC 0259]MTJ49508.1 hypothetical protein [Dolichospermum sp. UHCC 0259]
MNSYTRFPAMFEYFIPEIFIPIDNPFPMYTALTTRGSTDTNQERPIFDGRFYIPNFENLYRDSQKDWFKKDLKWSIENLRYIRLFLKHLTLYLTAHAVKNQIKEIQWCISYPPNFSRRDKYEYAQMWQNITDELQNQTGIKHLSPNINDNQYLRSENLALAQYFAEFEQYDLVNTTCIDIGNTVSNISIWQNNQLIHQCSLNFGKRDLFSQFITTNPTILTKFDPNFKQSDWKNLPEDVFYQKLDVWLRLESANWLETKRDRFVEDKDFQGLIRLMAISVSGLYFYIGQILSALHKEGKYTFNEITPVYIGGIGSRLLHWLAEGGEFSHNSEINSLLSSIISEGSGFPNTEELTRISKNPQEEVACGLVLKDKKLDGLGIKEKDPIIAGEDCIIGQEQFGWQERLQLQAKSINRGDYQIPTLNQLKLFLDAFHVSLDQLGIDGIKPLERYELKEHLDDHEPDYNEKLWRATERELKNSLITIEGKVENIREEAPFIIGLKALLKVLGKEWAGK